MRKLLGLLLLTGVVAFLSPYILHSQGTGGNANPLAVTRVQGATGGTPAAVGGQNAQGAASTGNPVRVAGWDGVVTATLRTGKSTDDVNSTANTGILRVQLMAYSGVGSVAPVGAPITVADGVLGYSQLAVSPYLFNGTNYDRRRTASLINYPPSTTLTARNVIGAAIGEKGSRWTVVSNPAAGSQATASIASEASVRHIVDCISLSAASTTAPALTALTVNVRDGATGAGTVIWTQQLAIEAVAGQNVRPFNACGLNLSGTTATAMTLEFSAGLANLIESVSISGFNVN